MGFYVVVAMLILPFIAFLVWLVIFSKHYMDLRKVHKYLGEHKRRRNTKLRPQRVSGLLRPHTRQLSGESNEYCAMPNEKPNSNIVNDPTYKEWRSKCRKSVLEDSKAT